MGIKGIGLKKENDFFFKFLMIEIEGWACGKEWGVGVEKEK